MYLYWCSLLLHAMHVDGHHGTGSEVGNGHKNFLQATGGRRPIMDPASIGVTTCRACICRQPGVVLFSRVRRARIFVLPSASTALIWSVSLYIKKCQLCVAFSGATSVSPLRPASKPFGNAEMIPAGRSVRIANHAGPVVFGVFSVAGGTSEIPAKKCLPAAAGRPVKRPFQARARARVAFAAHCLRCAHDM